LVFTQLFEFESSLWTSEMNAMNLFRGFTLLSFWLAALMVGPVRALELTRVTVGSAAFQVEMAQTAQERERGLMFRRELPHDRGMLFVQSSGPAAFWMKNTYIPLDLLYFDADGALLQIEANTPPCTTPTCPIYPSNTVTVRYILEINAGEAARRGIRVGDRLQLE
jgi:uncharacterized membrane protein (UPF0127 family)